MTENEGASREPNDNRALQRRYPIFGGIAGFKVADGDRLLGFAGREFDRSDLPLIPTPREGM